MELTGNEFVLNERDFPEYRKYYKLLFIRFSPLTKDLSDALCSVLTIGRLAKALTN